MTVRIVISGETRCEIFAEICLVADYLSQNLPHFCWERIEKSLFEWKAWLLKINLKNKWHHIGSPLVWKEMLHKGSKAFYIGGASEFLEYCHSYYNLDSFLTSEKLGSICHNFMQFQLKLKDESTLTESKKTEEKLNRRANHFVICITGAGNPLTEYLISGLLELAVGEKHITKIFLFDCNCTPDFMELVEAECRYIFTDNPRKVVRYVEKIGSALSYTDLLIVLDHVPFKKDYAIGEWLSLNKELMNNLALMINASANRKMYILLPNIGPSCYNATVLAQAINIQKRNIVVATSDLGLEISQIAAEIAEVPMRNMFCPPVWGFVGINKLVDIRTTVHRYCPFEPYNRYTKVMNSSLVIGSITPEFRTMEYLMYFDNSLWQKVAEMKSHMPVESKNIHKAVAVLDVVKLWLIKKDPNHIVNLGIRCNGALTLISFVLGTFGLHFKGVFSQPSRLVDGEWVPAFDFPLPKDPYIKLQYLDEMAEFTMQLTQTDLPPVVPYTPCSCKPKLVKKKGVW